MVCRITKEKGTKMVPAVETINSGKVVETLQDEATKDDVFNAMCELFAQRKRTRSRVTLKGLMLAMQYVKGSGNWSDKDYAKALEKLAKIGFGNLKYNSKNEVVALDNVKITLQSIGKAALMKGDELAKKKTAYKNKFKELEPASFIENNGHTMDAKPKSRSYGMFLTVMINNSPVTFPGPEKIKPEDLGAFLLKFNELVKSVS